MYNPYNLRCPSTFSGYILRNFIRYEHQIIASRAELGHRTARGEPGYHGYKNRGPLRGSIQGWTVTIFLNSRGPRSHTRVRWNTQWLEELLRASVILWWVLSSLHSCCGIFSTSILRDSEQMAASFKDCLCVPTKVIRRFKPLQSRLDYLIKVTAVFACSPEPVK